MLFIRQAAAAVLFLPLVAGGAPRPAIAGEPVTVWETTQFDFRSAETHPWHSTPAYAEFVHRGSDTRRRVPLFSDGRGRWVARFAPTRAGEWEYTTHSDDKGLDAQSGRLTAVEPKSDELRRNPNLRGHVRIAPDNRAFQYADGTPYLPLADTLWDGNTLRCGLNERGEGPFAEYLADRKSKGFTAVLMRYLAGFGDNPKDPTGEANEGGRAFADRDLSELNPEYFRALDRRVEAIIDGGLVPITPVCWWGKTSGRFCPVPIDKAEQIVEYLSKRYASYTGVWCLSGEYQYALRDCGWDANSFDRLGRAVRRSDAYDHPLSIHPSSRTEWPAPHDQQSSIAFHESDWLDHHWLQTGQSARQMANIVSRAQQHRKLTPTMPVFCSEAYYEKRSDPNHTYHSRWQYWTAMLNGCAGYGYGAWGVWNVYKPDSGAEFKSSEVENSSPFDEAVGFEGSSQMRHLRDLFDQLEWWRLEPARDRLTVDGGPCPKPKANDLTPPQCAGHSEGCFIVYIPRGNAESRIALEVDTPAGWRLVWLNPRNGERIATTDAGLAQGGELPSRPSPADEDWVAILRR
ncbi:DUF5060 domain-containing protein [Botrimarina sp.]|uniref:DUF5060 domain-containing protein n=1 Tax=Botrimarina sp. TaxID=2795802 RepID=UPI0032EFDD6A